MTTATQQQQTQTQAPASTTPAIDLDEYVEAATVAFQQAMASGRDTSGLKAEHRGALLNELARALKLNPLTKPVIFLKTGQGESIYVTRQGTDQIAARLRLNRETVAGPDIRKVGTADVAYCQVKVTAPDGRFETSTATLPATDFAMVLMKVESKAKRRATLSMAGLGMLSEEDAEEMLASGGEPTFNREPGADVEASEAETAFYGALTDCTTHRDAVRAWVTHRAAVTADGDVIRERAFARLTKFVRHYMETSKSAAEKFIREQLSVADAEIRAGLAAKAPETPKSETSSEFLPAPTEVAEAKAAVDALPTLETAEAKRDPFATVARHADDADGDGVIAQVVQAIRAAGTLTGGDKQALWNAALDCLAAFEIANAEARLRAALQPPTPDGNGGGRSRAKASGANAQGAGSEGAANTQGAPQASVRVVPDGEHLDATARDAEQALVVDALAWERHLAETVARKLADPKAKDPHLAVRCALAQGYANRRFDFTKAGGQKLREERHDATVRAMRPYGGDDASNTALVAKKCGTTYGTVDENVLTMRRPSQAAGLAPTGTGD